MEIKECKAALEAMVFACGEPVSTAHLAAALDIDDELAERLLLSIRDDCEADDRGVMLLQLENRWQFASKVAYGDSIRTVMDTRRNVPLSAAALEVLAVIAYNQPVSRSFVEQVRGVDSSSTVQTLMQKNLVEEAGRLDLPGHPISFRTTDTFLRTFGLSSLRDLPSLHDEGMDYAQPELQNEAKRTEEQGVQTSVSVQEDTAEATDEEA